MKIYLDMDGVLANFEKRFSELYGPRPHSTEDRVRHFWKHWDHFVDEKHFESLEPLPEAVAIVDAVRSLGVPFEILSSSSSFESPERHKKIAEQKTRWLWKNKIVCPVNIVTHAEDKARFAGPWNVLIDDTRYVLDHFGAAGGQCIHHVEIAPTLFELFDLHDEYMTYMRRLKP